MAELSLVSLYRDCPPISQVQALLSRETDAKRLADFSRAIEAAKTIDGKNIERQRYWGTLAIWSDRRLGEIIRSAQVNGTLASQGRPKEKSHDVTLKDCGIERMQSARAQKLADIPAKQIEQYVARQSEAEDEISKAGLLRFATGTEKAGLAAHVSANTGVPEWYTPPVYLEAARAVLGKLDLDPASSQTAQRSVRATQFYSLADDGLSKRWKGSVWLNPPYTGGIVDKFVEKLCEHFLCGDVKAAILLTNNATETAWYQPAAQVAACVCFPKGRIRFIDEHGEPGGAPLQGQSFLYFGREKAKFCGEFSEFGFCAEILK